MSLHTASQKEGNVSGTFDVFAPTLDGYMRFMVESRIVYQAFEDIVHHGPCHASYARLANTGLERSASLALDIDYVRRRWSVDVPRPLPHLGSAYADLLFGAAEENPPGFVCHYYNHYFAHTAGGRMIGKRVSASLLDGWSGAFYEWEGDLGDLVDNVRDVIEDVAERWSPAEREACLSETPVAFQWGTRLVNLMTPSG